MHESKKWKWSRSVGSVPQRPHGLQPTRLLHPWYFPGKSTGVGCHCLLWTIQTRIGICFLPEIPHCSLETWTGSHLSWNYSICSHMYHMKKKWLKLSVTWYILLLEFPVLAQAFSFSLYSFIPAVSRNSRWKGGTECLSWLSHILRTFSAIFSDSFYELRRKTYQILGNGRSKLKSQHILSSTTYEKKSK